MDCIESYEHAGMTVKITIDPMPQDCNPREDINVGVMLCGHRRYILGDEQVTGDDFSTAISCPSCNGTGENPQRGKLWRRRPYGWVTIGAGSIEAMQGEMAYLIACAAKAGRTKEATELMVETCDCPRCEGQAEIEVSLDVYLREQRGATVVLPLGLIDHSGISMYVGAGAHRHDPGGCDSGQVGVIFDTPETRKQCGMEDTPPDEIERALRAEVNAYDRFLRGEVYCFTITDPGGEHVDSCCGFLGDLAYVRSRANDAADHAARAASRERDERHLMACRDIETV